MHLALLKPERYDRVDAYPMEVESKLADDPAVAAVSRNDLVLCKVGVAVVSPERPGPGRSPALGAAAGLLPRGVWPVPAAMVVLRTLPPTVSEKRGGRALEQLVACGHILRDERGAPRAPPDDEINGAACSNNLRPTLVVFVAISRSPFSAPPRGSSKQSVRPSAELSGSVTDARAIREVTWSEEAGGSGLAALTSQFLGVATLRAANGRSSGRPASRPTKGGHITVSATDMYRALHLVHDDSDGVPTV